MPSRTFKLIELVGISDKSFDDAASNAIRRASATLKGLAWFEVVEQRGLVKDGKVGEYQVKLRVAFRLMDADEMSLAGEPAPGKRRR